MRPPRAIAASTGVSICGPRVTPSGAAASTMPVPGDDAAESERLVHRERARDATALAVDGDDAGRRRIELARRRRRQVAGAGDGAIAADQFADALRPTR